MTQEQEPFLNDFEKNELRRDSSTQTSKWHLLIAVMLSATVSISATLAIQDSFTSVAQLPGLSVPKFGEVTKSFMFNAIYIAKPNITTKAAWSALIPKGRGFVSADKLRKAGSLPPFLLSESNTTSPNGQYSIAVFHQLHCLSYINNAYHLALDEREHDVEHVFHCFEYIRNSLLCTADTALEPWREEVSDIPIHGVDGFGTERSCRDIDAVMKWAEKYRANDQEGI